MSIPDAQVTPASKGSARILGAPFFVIEEAKS
jgi:hypothetical protein